MLVFYSIECPHCKEMLPKLAELYKKQDGNRSEIVAVSIDEQKDAWLSYLYATPTMILLDKEQKIIAKPITMEEVGGMVQ